ncbi:SDR family oxidoreductase [Candidatus Mycolicibacterium alkanivorans]|uniref:SDR family oxidoreductase n=1 Tax=Candidatus Mycolicibacterium alkanivorans TaxID=2954114 RepID=A0ABS9YT48_9MYCO|nr:SDR family oxidoreductase [Candidatus Mycolicibacterium alkanivorans]MCI4674062.1 SDR family oxidoreductase [Candidatus Mycolicibacterium alkanivorans]
MEGLALQPTAHEPRIVLVTGASRGIGAEVARQLSDPGTHVVINYREKRKRAISVVDDIRRRGGHASAVQADLTDTAAVASMIAGIASQFGRLDALALNASGGLERGADPSYAIRLNRDAQLNLTHSALPLMTTGARIVFITSHQAHFYPEKPVPDDYVPIAQSKRAGENALRDLQPRLSQHGVGLAVVSSDMIDGTIIIRLLERRDPASVAARRAHAPLPTVEEFAAAIVTAINSSDQNGRTTYVGGADYRTATAQIGQV